MYTFKTRAAAIAVAFLTMLLAACSSGLSSQEARPTPQSATVQASNAAPDKPSESASIVVTAPFTARVDNRAIGDDCLKVNCWQPTQFDATLVDGESVSREEEMAPDGTTVIRPGWPNNGDLIEIICFKPSVAYSGNDPQGRPIKVWYAVRVPADKLSSKVLSDPQLASRLTKAPDGNGFLGFIAPAWVTGDEGKLAPAC